MEKKSRRQNAIESLFITFITFSLLTIFYVHTTQHTTTPLQFLTKSIKYYNNFGFHG